MEYEQRKGAQLTDLGRKYEKWFLTYLALNCCLENIDDFWIMSNADGLGVFDDIVLYVKNRNEKDTVLFVQLKHKEDHNNPAKIDINTFVQDYKNIRKMLTEPKAKTKYPMLRKLLFSTKVDFIDMHFALITNSSEVHHMRKKNKQYHNEIQDGMLELKPTEGHGILELIETSNNNNIYTLSCDVIDANFSKQFCILLNQIGAHFDQANIENVIKDKIHDLFGIAYEYIHNLLYQFYNKIVSWFINPKGVLQKSIVTNILLEIVTSHLKLPIPNLSLTRMSDDKWKIWEKIISSFRVVIITDVSNLSKTHFEKKSQIIFNHSNNNEDTIISILKHFTDLKTIVVIENKHRDHFIAKLKLSNISVLNDASDLLDINEKIKRMPIIIHSKEILLEHLISSYKNILHVLSPDEILKLLNSNLQICESFVLPKYYITRSVNKIILNPLLFQLENCHFLLVDDNSLINKFIDQFSLQISDDKYTVCKSHNCDFNDYFSKHENVHIIGFIEHNANILLEWIYSKCSNIYEIENCINNNINISLSCKEFIARTNMPFYRKLLISCDPGMGKTLFLKFLNNEVTNAFWPIFIELSTIDFSIFIDMDILIYDYMKRLNTLDRFVFQEKFYEGTVLILFDGFDEIEREYFDSALKLIEGAIEKNFKVFVSTRNVTKDELEKTLNVLPLNLLPFNANDKLLFLDKYYTDIAKSNNLKNVDNITPFSHTLLETLKCSSWDENFSGIPLQCHMLSESFVSECFEYCETKIIKLPKTLTLISLYEKYIDTKFSILFKEKLKTGEENKLARTRRKEIENQHMVAAVHVLFPNGKVNIDEKFMVEILNGEEKSGLITAIDKNCRAVFIHRTIAEFLTALWFVKNGVKENNLSVGKEPNYSVKLLYKSKYTTVKELYERLICRNNEFHTAILNQDIELVTEILQCNKQELFCACRRSALHIISSRGAKHKNRNGKFIERIGEDKYLDILKIILENNIWTEDKDDVLGWTPLEYAINRNAIGIIDVLLDHGYKISVKQSKFKSLFNSVANAIIKTQNFYNWRKEDKLIMCAKYDYPNFAKNISNLEELDRNNLMQLIKIALKYDSKNMFDKLICLAVGTKLSKKYKLMDELTSNGSELIGNRILFNTRDENNNTILHIAVELSNLTLIEKHSHCKELANERNNEGRTPLHVAAYINNILIIDILLQEPLTNANIRNNMNRTPLNVARLNGHVESFLKLFHKTDEKNKEDLLFYEKFKDQDLLWFRSNIDSAVPSNAFVGATSDGYATYIGRTFYNGRIFPVQIIPHKKLASFRFWNETELRWDCRNVQDYEILCGNDYVWLEYTKGMQFPINAVRGGCTVDSNYARYIGRIKLFYHLIGWIRKDYTDCKLYTSRNGMVFMHLDNFEILTLGENSKD